TVRQRSASAGPKTSNQVRSLASVNSALRCPHEVTPVTGSCLVFSGFFKLSLSIPQLLPSSSRVVRQPRSLSATIASANLQRRCSNRNGDNALLVLRANLNPTVHLLGVAANLNSAIQNIFASLRLPRCFLRIRVDDLLRAELLRAPARPQLLDEGVPD